MFLLVTCPPALLRTSTAGNDSTSWLFKCFHALMFSNILNQRTQVSSVYICRITPEDCLT